MLIFLCNLTQQFRKLLAVVREIQESLDNLHVWPLLPHEDMIWCADGPTAADLHIMIAIVPVDAACAIDAVRAVRITQFHQQLPLTAAQTHCVHIGTPIRNLWIKKERRFLVRP